MAELSPSKKPPSQFSGLSLQPQALVDLSGSSNVPSFGQFVCIFCAANPPPYPLPSSHTLEDLADLYLYRFDEDIDLNALSNKAKSLYEACHISAHSEEAFESEMYRILQTAADCYFMGGWTNQRMISVNRCRLEQLRRTYPSQRQPLECSHDSSLVPELKQQCWDRISSSDSGLVLLDIFADYCSACKKVKPAFLAAAETLQKRSIASCYLVNGPQNPRLKIELKVDVYPCFKVMYQGQEVGQLYPPARCTSTDIINFVLPFWFCSQLPQAFSMNSSQTSFTHGFSELSRGASAATLPISRGFSAAGPSWSQKLQSKGIDMIEDMEADRRHVLLHEKFKALCGGSEPICCDGLRVATAEQPPRAIFLGGGMGAGKSTVVRAMGQTAFWKEHGEQVVIVEADAFTMQDPLFIVLLGAGVKNASELVHDVSIASAEDLLLDALKLGRDVVFDGTMSWLPFVEQTVKMVRSIHRNHWHRGPGYSVDISGEKEEQYWIPAESRTTPGIPYLIEMVGVTVDPEVAVQRGIVRYIMSNRDIPVASQLQSHRMFSENFSQYLELFDAVALLDNNDGSAMARPIVLKGRSIFCEEPVPKDTSIVDAEAYARFQHKTLINPGATNALELYTHEASPAIQEGEGNAVND